MQSQSAMEYLMTYGWAILIIAVILGLLFALGIFSNESAPFVCLGAPNFLCSSPTLSSSGGMTVKFGLSGLSNYPITITGLMCNITIPGKVPSVETTRLTVTPNEELNVVFQCPFQQNSNLGKAYPVDLWIYYSTPYATNLTLEFARGIVKVNYLSLLWNVTEWAPSSNTVDLLPYSDLTSNPVSPSGITVVGSSEWSSFVYNGTEGWSYSTDYHNNDVYNGIETTLFPITPLSLDNAPCSAPFDSHGYIATTYANLNGVYTFGTWSDDGTEIFYRPSSGGAWSSVFGGSAWLGQPPTYYSQSINFPKGDYEIVVDYTDTCDPAGLSTVIINPAPVPASA